MGCSQSIPVEANAAAHDTPKRATEKPSLPESAPPVVNIEKSIETGSCETEKTTVIDGDEVEGTAVSPSTEALETKPKDLEKGLAVEIETQIQTTVDAADTIGEAASSELSDDEKDEVTSKEETSVVNVVSEEIGEPPNDKISADTVTTSRQGLEQPSASIVEEYPAAAKEIVEVPMEETSPAASMSLSADGALETEDEDGESVVTRPIETNVAAVEIDAVEVDTDKQNDEEAPILEDDAMPVTDEEDDAVVPDPTERQKYEKESTLTGPTETQAMADAPVISVEKEVDDSESESAAKQPDLVESSVESAMISSATTLIENNENPRSAVVKAPEAQSQVLKDIANEQVLAETEIKNESSEVKLTSVVAEEVPLADLEGIIDVPIDEDSVSGESEGSMDGETETITERSVYQGRATEELRSRVVAEASQAWGVPVIAEVDPLEGIIDVPIDEDSVSGVPEGGMDGENETITKAEADPLDAPVATASEATACGGETPGKTDESIPLTPIATNDAEESALHKSEELVQEPAEAKEEVDSVLETSKDVVVSTEADKAIEERIEITRVSKATSGGSTNETTTQSKSSTASDNVFECIDDAVVDVTKCVPIADDEDSDSDYDYEEESGFEVAEYDYEEDESMLELDSSHESDSDEESDDDKSTSAAEDDDDDDPIFTLKDMKNVTAMTRVLIPEDQRQNNHSPTSSRWGWASRLGRTNTSNSNLSFSGQEESVAKIDLKSELKGSPLSGSPTKDKSADKKEDPTKTIGTLMKKLGGTDTENRVNASSELTATVPPAVSTKEVPKRKPLTDIEKARMFAASILLETEEKTIPKAVTKSGFGGWLKR